MRIWIVATAATLALSVAAQAAPEAERGGDSNKADNLMCRNVAETGSRLARKRVCRTREQWAEQRRLERSEIERLQVWRGRGQ